jgi:hypothetical protein
MPERIDRAAEISIGRGVGFAALAIGMVMAALSFAPTLALDAGAFLTLLLWAALEVKARRARRTPYKRTEVWIMLDPPPHLPARLAQERIAEARRLALRRYARQALAAAAGFWLVSLGARLAL